MAATLQRSSYSFRRQGSSGRIWTCQAVESKTRNNVLATSEMNAFNGETETQRKELRNDRVSDSIRDLREPSSSSKSENKVHRNILSSIFGRCMR